MKNKLQIFLACVAAVTVCAPAYALPRPKKSASPTPTPTAAATAAQAAASPTGKAERAIPFHGMISSVDGRARTFTIAGKEKSRTFKITDKTVITKTGQPATMKDVVANEEARGAYWKMADGSMELRSLKVGPPTEQEKAATDKRKQRRTEKKAAAGGASASPGASPATSASPSPH